MRLQTGPREVIGYHGCTREVAERLVSGESWLPSQNRYDWLGEGIYFWEYAPYRSLEWAIDRYGGDSAVIQSRIGLGECLNLLDRRDFMALQHVYGQTVDSFRLHGLPVPLNSSRGAHFLDRHIIDEFCTRTRPDRHVIQSVRGCFPEGDPLYPGSKILTLAHVQIAIRDPACIRSAQLVQFPHQRRRRGHG
jgi:hypothetical protein